MKVPRIAGVLPVFVAAGLFQPLAAQTAPGHQWTASRPDAHAPVSVTEDRTLPAGELEFSLRLLQERFQGQGVGGDSLTLDEVLSFYTVAPTEMVTRGAQLGIMWGVTSHLTLSATGTFVQKKMDLAVTDPGNQNLFWLGQSETFGPEDVRVNALFNVFDREGVRVHLQGGASIPVGSIEEDDEILDPTNPSASTTVVLLPYQQQLGSGTVDVLPGATASIQNEVGSLGIQAAGVIRIGDNDRGWALGDVFQGTFWGAYAVSEMVSVSAGARYTTWGNVEGFDPALLISGDPAYDSPAYSGLQSGSMVEIPLGINFVLTEGRFQGHRVGIEFLVPVDQSLDYTQLRRDWSVVVGWTKGISF